jgi:hypothetical protein
MYLAENIIDVYLFIKKNIKNYQSFNKFIHFPGRVVGIECNAQQEARYLQHFLDAVKDIYPPVFGEEYSFHFSPLLEDNGRQHCEYFIGSLHIGLIVLFKSILA